VPESTSAKGYITLNSVTVGSGAWCVKRELRGLRELRELREKN
jgi:hypothetical protein